jgi:hypothetical protein
MAVAPWVRCPFLFARCDLKSFTDEGAPAPLVLPTGCSQRQSDMPFSEWGSQSLRSGSWWTDRSLANRLRLNAGEFSRPLLQY